jgi:hypothetical protein
MANVESPKTAANAKAGSNRFMGKRPARLILHKQCTLFSAISAARSSGTEQDKSTHEKACKIQSALQGSLQGSIQGSIQGSLQGSL